MTFDCSTLRDFLPALPVCVHVCVEERHERFLLSSPRVYVCFRSCIIKRSLLKCHQSSFDVARKEPRKPQQPPSTVMRPSSGKMFWCFWIQRKGFSKPNEGVGAPEPAGHCVHYVAHYKHGNFKYKTPSSTSTLLSVTSKQQNNTVLLRETACILLPLSSPHYLLLLSRAVSHKKRIMKVAFPTPTAVAHLNIHLVYTVYSIWLCQVVE